MLDSLKPDQAQPTARRLAQMRLAATKAGLTGPLADLMAETGVTSARADAIAAGLVQIQQMTVPFSAAGSGRLDEAALMSIAKRALTAGAAVQSDDAAAITAEIVRVGGDEAMALMASAEPQHRGYAQVRIDRSASAPSRAEAMADGLLARMQAGHTPTHGREFASMRLEEMSRLSSDRSGYLNSGGRRPIMYGAMGVDDFAAALAIASNKVLLDAYEASESQIKRASRQVSAPDFRPINSVRVSGGVELGKVLENGEFTQGQRGGPEFSTSLPPS